MESEAANLLAIQTLWSILGLGVGYIVGHAVCVWKARHHRPGGHHG